MLGRGTSPLWLEGCWSRGIEDENSPIRQVWALKWVYAVHLRAQTAQLNRRPRQTLDWHTPSEKMIEPGSNF